MATSSSNKNLKPRLDLVGQRFGRLVVLSFVSLDARRNSQWLCACDCGSQKTCVGNVLKRGRITSCGCKNHEPRVDRRAEDHPDFGIFSGMLNRCSNPNDHNYKRYGGRGIKVCERWKDGGFWVFHADMGTRPSPQHSIDRIDNNSDYEPGNCRWATDKEQMRNRRNNHIVECFGERLTLAEWSERTGIDKRTLRARLVELKWPVEKALTFKPRRPSLAKKG